MKTVFSLSRYLVLIAVIALLLGALAVFVFGGITTINVIIETFEAREFNALGARALSIEFIEMIDIFLLGTILMITSVGLYQLFVHEIKFPNWLKIDSTEELETNLIGVTVVVLAVNFMGAVFVGGTENLLQYGAGIALPIAALGLFIGLRAWSTKLDRELAYTKEARKEESESKPQSQQAIEEQNA